MRNTETILEIIQGFVLIVLMSMGVVWLGFSINDMKSAKALANITANINQAVSKLSDLKDDRVDAILGIKR